MKLLDFVQNRYLIEEPVDVRDYDLRPASYKSAKPLDPAETFKKTYPQSDSRPKISVPPKTKIPLINVAPSKASTVEVEPTRKFQSKEEFQTKKEQAFSGKSKPEPTPTPAPKTETKSKMRELLSKSKEKIAEKAKAAAGWVKGKAGDIKKATWDTLSPEQKEKAKVVGAVAGGAAALGAGALALRRKLKKKKHKNN